MTPNHRPPLQLYFHPFASFCQKVLVALYENGTPFEPHIVDLGDPASREAFLAIWPVGRMPVLVDRAANRTLPESSIIIEYLDRHRPGATPLIPDEFDKALKTRLGRAHHQRSQARQGLSGPPDEPAVLCPRRGGGEALQRSLPTAANGRLADELGDP